MSLTFLEEAPKWSENFSFRSRARWIYFLHTKYSGVSNIVAGSSSVSLLVWRRFFLGDLDCPKVLPDFRGFSEFLGRTALQLRATSQGFFLPYGVIVSRLIWFRWAASLLSGSILSAAVCPHVLRGGEGKIAVIEEFVSSVLRGFNTNLPCPVVTLESAVSARYGYSKTSYWSV